MPTYVLDTSIVVQWFHYANEHHVLKAKKLWEELQAEKINIIVPDILLLELLNAFIKGKYASAERSYLVLAAFCQTPVTIVEISLPVLEVAATLMEKYNIASYDAYFLALAKREECKLISDDTKAHGQITDGTVLMLKDYQSA